MSHIIQCLQQGSASRAAAAAAGGGLLQPLGDRGGRSVVATAIPAISARHGIMYGSMPISYRCTHASCDHATRGRRLYTSRACCSAKTARIAGAPGFAGVDLGGVLLRSRGRGLHVDRLEKSRNWEAWVAELEVAISGYTDPGSSHSTRLIRRKGDSDCKYMPYRVPHHPCVPIHSAPHTQARSKCMSASMHISC